MRKQLVTLALFSTLTITGVMTLNLQSNDTFTERGEGLQLSCLISEEFMNYTIQWISPQNVRLSTCHAIFKLCTGNSSSYSFTTDNKGAYAYINSLNRTMDNGTWKCVYRNTTANIDITVYTSPAGVHFVQPIPPDSDLGVESLTLTCQTDNCCYPAPNIAWYYTTSLGQISLYQWSTGNIFSNTIACTQSEVTYTSILQLPLGTTFIGNILFRSKFVCGVQHPTFKGDIKFSENSSNVTFAVNLSFVTLRDSYGNDLPNIVELVTGTPVTLICVTSTSRPTASVNWYIENMRITCWINNVLKTGNNGLEYLESRLTFIPSNKEHHNKMIYCQAYSYNSNDFLQSDKSTMFIKVTPEKPINFHATNVLEKQLWLRWLSVHNEEFSQTFVVEISIDNITWNNVSQVESLDGNGWFSISVENLIPGCKYYLRLYAYNIHGRGDFADVQPAIRTLKECAGQSSLEVGASVGIGVGGAVLGLISAIIAFTIRRQFNEPKSSCFRRKGTSDNAKHTYSNTEMNPQTQKAIYEELTKGNAERNMYEKISAL